MTDSNRLQLAVVRETTHGTTPTTPRMRKARSTGESLQYRPDYVQSDEIRDDRMNSDPIKVGESNSGGISFEWHYPADQSPLSEAIASAFFNDWSNTPSRDNDGTADSVITAVTAATQVVTVTTGTAFVAGHLVRFSGFGQPANSDKLAKCTTGSATVPAFLGADLVDEAAPAAAARMKVVGFEGASGDITATATGLGSTSLDFTTITGLAVGKWVKIGGTGAGYRFADENCNVWGRITAIAANALTLDNLPATWTTNAGTGKTIRVFFGDQIKNGTTKIGLTVERGFLGQSTPTYIAQRGMTVNRLQIQVQKKQKITGSFDFMGLGGSQSTTPLDASPDAALDNENYPVMAAGANVGRIAENGSVLSSPNWASQTTIEITNNLRMIEAADSVSAVDIGVGSCDVMVNLDTYFGDNALYAKLLAGTATNYNMRIAKGSKALVWGLPRLTPMEGNPNAGGKNQDVMLPLRLQASKDSLTGVQVLLDRLEYFEA